MERPRAPAAVARGGALLYRGAVRKVVIDRPGDWDVLRLAEAPDPEPGPGEVAIDVAACGVNFADCVVRMGLYESAKKYVGWPITPGFEVAGSVARVGAGVEELAPGDEVLAVTRFGGYATRIVVPARQALPRPRELTAAQAAAFPAVSLTAWYGLMELGSPRPGARVLVHSAAGGVGSALVQLAKIRGCHVTGVVGATHKIEAVRALEADAVIDKSREPLWAEAERHAPDGYDVVLDANGVQTLRQSYKHLAPGGRLVVYGFHSMLIRGRGRPSWPKLARDWLRTPRFDPLEMTNSNRSVMAFNLSYMFDRADLLSEGMDALLGWVREGWLRPPSVTPYPLDQVADAQRALESGSTIGKLVLTTGHGRVM